MNGEGQEIPGVSNSEWFRAMALTKRDMANETTDPVAERNLRDDVLAAGMRFSVERAREELQEWYPGIELPTVLDGERVSEYFSRAFEFLKESGATPPESNQEGDN